MGASENLMLRAKRVIPGGVNSPVRAYASVGMVPRFVERADGPYIWDADGRRYVDYVCSWGPMVLGHNDGQVRTAVQQACERGLSFGAATQLEVEMAEFVCGALPHVDMVRMVNSGTEAVMSALRLARGFTGRAKVVKFAGCYHGHSDCMLVDAGSGLLTSGVPSSAGVTPGCVQDTLAASYNDLGSVEAIFAENPGQIAAVIVEPVAANMGVVLPAEGFLQGLRDICDREGALLVFDEVITGFRLAFGGAVERFGVVPDLVTYGKIIGGGMPVGAFGGRGDVMALLAPQGPVYQAGTLSGNPIAMTAGLAQLRQLYAHPEWYAELDAKGQELFGGMARLAGDAATVNWIGSLGCAFFAPGPIASYADVQRADTERYAAYFKRMLDAGIMLAPSQFEAMFVSCAHGEEVIGETLDAFAACVSGN